MHDALKDLVQEKAKTTHEKQGTFAIQTFTWTM
jgi:hypothetical protein